MSKKKDKKNEQNEINTKDVVEHECGLEDCDLEEDIEIEDDDDKKEDNE
ncbi:MAG: hypothetical protein Q4G04_00630 [bacterium]|nr:hypothetical protein [bacterium]